MGHCFSTPQTHGGNRRAPPPAPPQLQPEELLPPAPPQLRPEELPPSEICESSTCKICIEPIESSEQTYRPKNGNCAAHRFCNNCMIKYIEVKLDDNIPKIPCPAPTCPEFLNPHEYRVLVAPPLFVRWCDALCEAALAGMEKCHCPNRSCSELVVNECGGAAVTKTTCPGCKREFCFQCKLTWHARFRCEELRDQNDRAFGALAEEKKWKRCPRCHHFVERIEGCYFIRCRCDQCFCYDCGENPHRRDCRHKGEITH